MTNPDLASFWSAIETPPAGAMAGGCPPELAALGVILAVDHTGLRHLLVPAHPDDAPPAQSETRGLEVRVDELRIGDSPARWFFDVACRDATVHPNFVVLAGEVIGELDESAAEPRRTLGRILERWRWFWGAPPGGLTDEEALGLFGELWFFEYWLGLRVESLDAWQGPTGDRHDFKWPAASVEVKATRVRSDGSAEHRISNLDQLEDPETGDLYLFSLRVTPDPIAHHSLADSVDRIRATLESDPTGVHRLDELLGRVGFSPAHRQQYATPLRVVAEELYRVCDDFPRLTRDRFTGGIPPGVGDIVYTLDLGACQAWRLATHPGDDAARALAASLQAL